LQQRIREEKQYHIGLAELQMAYPAISTHNFCEFKSEFLRKWNKWDIIVRQAWSRDGNRAKFYSVN